MANRYWVGGTGTWNNTTTHWSTTSGGSGGASVPTSSDNVIFDSNSGSADYTVTLSYDSGYPSCYNFNATNPSSGTLTFSGGSLDCWASLNVSSGVKLSIGLSFLSTSTGNTITTNGAVPNGIYFNGSGGEWILQDNLTTNSRITLTQGTLDLNGYDISCNGFISSNSNTRKLKLGSGTFKIKYAYSGQAWDIGTSTNFTLEKETGTVLFSASLQNDDWYFKGGGLTYYNFWNDLKGSTVNYSGKVIIEGSNTFNNFKIGGNGNGTRTEFTAGTTQTVTTFNADGVYNASSGYLAILQSSSTSAFTLSCSTGTIKCNYCDIKYSTVSGGATWYVANSKDSGNNTGWKFGAIVTTQAGTNISSTSFTANGNITDDGDASPTIRGFCYKLGSSIYIIPTTADSTAYDTGTYSAGAYTKSITGLTLATSYRVRAYVIDSAGTTYGDTVTVTTTAASAFIPRTMWFN